MFGDTLSSKKKNYIVIYDFSQTQTIDLTEKESDEKIEVIVGVSVRMVAKIYTKKSGINLANFFNIGLEASKKKVTGILEVRCSGIISQKINQIIPVTSDLSQASISQALQSVATIKSHIFDKETKIIPQFLAFSANGTDFNKIEKKIETFKMVL